MHRLAVPLITFALLTLSSVSAQVNTATIYGSVVDSTGAAVTQARISVSNEATNATASTFSDERGEFTLTFLPIGRYDITLSAQGFKTEKHAGVVLTAGQRARLSYRLEVGAITESVTVSGEAPLINAVSAEQRYALATQEVREMPLARRDWTGLLRVGTGIVSGSGQSSTGVTMNGLPPSGFTLTVDGTSASGDSEFSSLGLYQNFNFIKAISAEAISEVNVGKGIVPAEVGSAMSGNVNLISKSGTNKVHASLFHNFQAEDLNARNQFLATKAPVTFNQFGGSLGGPLIRDKLFLFGVYEGYRQRAFSAVNGVVPTREFRDQATAAVRDYKGYFDLFPLPNQPYAAGAITGTYQGAGSTEAGDNHAILRGDYYLTDHNLLTARYTRSRPGQVQPRLALGNPRNFVGAIEAGTLSYIHSRPSWSSETRYGHNFNEVLRQDAMFGNNIASISGNLGFSATGEDFYKLGSDQTVEEVIATTRGRHSIKFGGVFRHVGINRHGSAAPDFKYATAADLLANIPSLVTVTFGISPYDAGNWQMGGFVQDDIKLRRSLIVNLGARYDYFSVPRHAEGKFFNRDGPYGLGPLRPPDSIYLADRNNVSPRVGFAWTVGQSALTVVRGGFGVFHNPHTLVGGPLETVANGPTAPSQVTFSRAEALQAGLKYPVANSQVWPLVQALSTISGTTVNPNFPNPYSMQWTLSIQRQLTGSLAFETAYVGTRGIKLAAVRDVNLQDRLTGIRPYPRFSQFRYYDTSESSHYNSWQTSLRRRFSQDFGFNVNYTWASTLSYTGDADLLLTAVPQQFGNIRADKGPTSTDIRHRFVADFLYELPFARLAGRGRTAELLIGGWRFAGIASAQTGSPVNIVQSSTYGSSRPDYVGGNPVLSGATDTLRYLNVAAFAAVPIAPASGAPVRPGNLGRNALRGLGSWSLDLAVSKNIKLAERASFQLRAEMFNALNHTNLAGLSANITAANFGRLASATARTMQLNARVSF